jgi:hypothetical protein
MGTTVVAGAVDVVAGINAKSIASCALVQSAFEAVQKVGDHDRLNHGRAGWKAQPWSRFANECNCSMRKADRERNCL